MDFHQLLHEHHEQIESGWFQALCGLQGSRYGELPREELAPPIQQATHAFRKVLLEDQWDDLETFITQISHKRFGQGFTVSEVQRAFELYRQTLIPLIAAHVDPDQLEEVLLRLQNCMVICITRFSEFFQNIHEEFLRSQAKFLEQEVAKRTSELYESRRTYKNLVEEINDGYFVLADGRLVFVNRAFADMHGLDERQMLGANYLDYVAAESVEAVKASYESSRSGVKQPSRLEYLRLHRDGRKMATEIMATKSTFAGKPANIGICRDISKRVELEKRTREAEKLKALARQASSLAHDIRNPLSAVKMNLQIFNQNQSDPTLMRLVNISLSEIDGIERSLLEMIDLHIPFSLNRKNVNLSRFLDNCVQAMRERMDRYNVAVSMRRSRGLQYLSMDPQRMEQVLVNLLFNAIEAQPNGGSIFVTSRQVADNGGEWAEILVGDNGPGIPKEIMPYIFDPLFSQKSMGTGMGLYNVRKVVEAHGGRVDVKRRRPRGTNFLLRLPLGSE